MADAVEITLADAIVSAINAASWSLLFRAERSYLDVDATLEELDVLRVDVVMPDVWDSYELDDRSTDSANVSFEIAIRKRFGMEQQNQAGEGVQRAELDRLYTLAIDMARYFATDRFADVEANWLETNLVQAYDREQLAQDKQFLAVISLQFAVHRAL